MTGAAGVDGAELLSVAEMYAADGFAASHGIPTYSLMENAGRAIAHVVAERYPPQNVVVVCGPGNNGGDGFVAARMLSAAGWPVRVALIGDRTRLAADAATAASQWPGAIEDANPALLNGGPLVIDAIFGAGLRRPVDGQAEAMIAAMDACQVVAVDVPSGVNADSGRVMGRAATAAVTVTFFRKKTGHLLFPGRALCGETVVADIGIPDEAIAAISPAAFANGPGRWRYPWPRQDGHKYGRGHALVLGGGRLTGAARMAARSALRAGAGLVTIACPPEAFPIYAMQSPVFMIHTLEAAGDYHALAQDPKRNALLVGPGCGVTEITRARTLEAIATRKRCVVDADSLTAFAAEPERLLDALHDGCLLTPHDGEFARLFSTEGTKLDQARRAASQSGAVVLLKGPDTVIAAPDGRVAINANAPADLATAGSGDVLAGVAVGLMAAGLDAFDAGCAAAWLHGEAGTEVGPGLIAEDLPDALPAILRRLKAADA